MDAPSSVFHSDLSIEAKLERARTELLDLSARNRLLNVPRFSKAAKTIDVVDERSVEIFRLLIGERRTFTFVPGREEPVTDRDAGQDEEGLAELPQPGDEGMDERGVAVRHTDTRLQTRMTSKGLQRRLLDLYHDARTLEEEQGVNILFLALGMLRWIDPANADAPRHAPLILIPVQLERKAAGERFKLCARTEELSGNLSLEAFLERVHHLKLPTADPGEQFDIAGFFDAVADAVSTKPGWSVLPDDIVLGFFSFAKFLMYRDLDPKNWPAHASITGHPTIRALLADGFARRDPMISEDARVDDHISPAAMLHILDCDSSQTLAVHDARSERDLVIQGPPGTGKSQTIANIIASAVADGRTVLFVAEKMAALEVVKRRLDQAGVGDACLELHSNKANKRSVLDELRRTWQLGSPRGDFPDRLSGHLEQVRNVLNAHADRMHAPHGPSGLTPYQVFGHLVRLKQDGLRPNNLQLERPETWSSADVASRQALLSELADRVEDIGVPSQHPWFGVGLGVLTPPTVDRLMSQTAKLSSSLETWRVAQRDLARELEAEEPASFQHSPELITLARRIASAPDLDAEALGSNAWERNAPEIVALLSAGAEAAKLEAELQGFVASGAFETAVEDAIAVLEPLPPHFSEDAFAVVGTLHLLLPRLLGEANRLAEELGTATEGSTLRTLDRMVVTAERVAVAPDASPEAFAATVWDHGVEQASEVAEAVATLETVRHEIGERVTDAAWATDVASARDALASHTGLMRRLNGDWRRANTLVRTVLRQPDIPLPDQLACLDALMKGQAAAKMIREEDAFGRSAFGPDWRGEKSASAPLIALVEWMRTLRGLGAEPRLIAGRMPKRTALRDRASALKRVLDETRAKVTDLWAELGNAAEIMFGDAPAAEAAMLDTLRERVGTLAEADQQSRAVMTDGAAPLPVRLDRLRRVVAWQRASATVDAGEALGKAAFAQAWMRRNSDWRLLAHAAHWVASNPDIRVLAAKTADRPNIGQAADRAAAGHTTVTDLTIALFSNLATDASRLFGKAAIDELAPGALADRLTLWLDHPEHLSKWVSYRNRADAATRLGLRDVVAHIEDGRLLPPEIIPAFEMAYFEALLADIVQTTPELGRFDGTVHGRNVREFVDLDRQRIAAARLEVVRAHHRRIPPPGGVGPVGILRGEIARKRGHMPIRVLMQRASAAVQAMKPVLMMSPLSVAQFLTPGRTSFDLLVMDEASQIEPVDALGAIARCRQVVVVGDERQLPPTRFFARMTGSEREDDGEGAGVADIESILGLFTARGLPERMLRWHYRSRHQSLIAVSNSQFYEGKLFIVPSPYTSEAGMGLRFHHVPNGVFDSGGTGTNVLEAKLVAQEVIRHAKTEPGLSLGIATFSAAQRRAIQDELELLRRLNPDTEDFFHAHSGEPFFVKNLENVQGDERDVIMISVGYGRNAQGYMAMRFGPLGLDGGERRLNVLISRAKRRCEVYASITDEDLDLERNRSKGVFALKLFLHYARTGRLSIAQVSGRDPDSIFEEQVARALVARGYQVHPQVGIAGFFIDLAIADPGRPGRYILGIECDGASYHSSRSARDRDRLRQAVLEDHGWILHRIWSTDWFQRPQEQLDRVVEAVEAAKGALDARLSHSHPPGRAAQVEIITVERGDTTEISLEPTEEVVASSRAYTEASPSAARNYELHETPSGILAELVERVVAVEGPVHIDEVVSRLRAAWGLQRAGGRIQSAVANAVGVAVHRGRLTREGEFLSTPGQTVVVRDRSSVASSTLRRPEMLPPREIETAILQIAKDSLGAGVDEIITAVSRLFGFKATSAQLRHLIQAQIKRLQAAGALATHGGVLIVASGVPTPEPQLTQ